MGMSTVRIAWLLALAASVSAQAPRLKPGAEPSRYEISPSAGFMGGSVLMGVRAGMNHHPVTLEFATEQVIGRTATLYPFTMSAVLDLSSPARLVPYGTVGGGLFLTVPANSVGDQAVSSVGLCFGGGLRCYLFRKVGLRFETRQMFTRLQNKLDNREEILIFQSSSLGVIFGFG